MVTGIEEIDRELETIRAVHLCDDVDELISLCICEDLPDDFIQLVEDETGYVDLEKGYKEMTAILKLVKIDKYIKIGYWDTVDEFLYIKFIKQVFPYPKKTIKYL